MAAVETTTPPATVIHAHRYGAGHYGRTVEISPRTAKTARRCYFLLRRAGAGRHTARVAVVALISAGQWDEFS